MSLLHRLYQSHAGDEDSATWNLPDGKTLHLLVRTRRGSRFHAPSVVARLLDADYAMIARFTGRASGLNNWLAQWHVTL